MNGLTRGYTARLNQDEVNRLLEAKVKALSDGKGELSVRDFLMLGVDTILLDKKEKQA